LRGPNHVSLHEQGPRYAKHYADGAPVRQ
jgi:hypothetical protein